MGGRRCLAIFGTFHHLILTTHLIFTQLPGWITRSFISSEVTTVIKLRRVFIRPSSLWMASLARTSDPVGRHFYWPTVPHSVVFSVVRRSFLLYGNLPYCIDIPVVRNSSVVRKYSVVRKSSLLYRHPRCTEKFRCTEIFPVVQTSPLYGNLP